MKNAVIKKVVILIIFISMLLIQSTVFATGGQANGTSNTLYNKTVSYFFELIRSMETPTGTLAKSSNIDPTNYVDSSRNGIDCHMEKNTEYGTITILSASAYGNPTSTDSESTGVNNTGVFQMSNGKVEYVANTLQTSETSAKISNNYNRALTKADSRYVNEYKSTTKYSIPGDGIIETDNWGGTSLFINTGSHIFRRGMSGFFGYYGTYYGDGVQNYWYQGARAVVVCGPGL